MKTILTIATKSKLFYQKVRSPKGFMFKSEHIIQMEEEEVFYGTLINPLHITGLFLYPLKRSENQRFSDVFMGYRKSPVA